MSLIEIIENTKCMPPLIITAESESEWGLDEQCTSKKKNNNYINLKTY